MKGNQTLKATTVTLKKVAAKSASHTKAALNRTIRGAEQVEQEKCCKNSSDRWDRKTYAFLIILTLSMSNEVYRITQYPTVKFLTTLNYLTFTNKLVVDPRPGHREVSTYVSINVLHPFTAISHQMQWRDGLTTLRTTNRYAQLMSKVLTELTNESYCFWNGVTHEYFIGKADVLTSNEDEQIRQVDSEECEFYEAREGFEGIPVRHLTSDQLKAKSSPSESPRLNKKLVLCAYGPIAYQTDELCKVLGGKVIENADYAHQVSPLDHGGPLRTTNSRYAVLFSLISQFASPLPWALYILAVMSLAWKHSDSQIVMSGTRCTAFSCIVISTQIFGTLISLILFAPSNSQAYLWTFVGFTSVASQLHTNNALYRQNKKGAEGFFFHFIWIVIMLLIDYLIFGLIFDASLAAIFAVHFFAFLLSNAFYSKAKPWFSTLNLILAGLIFIGALTAVMLGVQIAENNTRLVDYLPFVDAIKRTFTITRYDSTTKFNTDDAGYASTDNHIDSALIEANLRYAQIAKSNSTYFNKESQVNECLKYHRTINSSKT